MALRVVILISLVGLSYGCSWTKHPGLYKNKFQHNTPALVTTSTVFEEDVTDAEGGSTDITLTNEMEIFDNANKVKKLRICDIGYIETEDSAGTLQACRASGAIEVLTTSDPPVIVADVLDSAGSDITKFHYTTYHVTRATQFNSANNVTGASDCDIKILAGLINDCEGTPRLNITVKEMVVVTWFAEYADSGAQNHYFQAFIALSEAGKTYVGFLYEGLPTIPGSRNRRMVGKVLGPSSRVAEICGGKDLTTTQIKSWSNCRCSEGGHYVFETKESLACDPASGTPSCTSQASSANDTTQNKNCRAPFRPQESCDASVHCKLSQGTYTIKISLKDIGYDAVNASFYNYTQFTTSIPSGFAQPWGDNLTLASGGLSACTFALEPAPNAGVNDTWAVKTFTGATATAINCMVFDAPTNQYKFVLRVYNAFNGRQFVTDGQVFIVGTCNIDDLAENMTHTHNVKQISSTTLPTPTGAALRMYISDRQTRASEQILSPGVKITLGRWLFIKICYTRPTDFLENLVAYGISAKSCSFSNSLQFTNVLPNYKIDTIGSDGCISATSKDKPGEMKDSFKVDDEGDRDPFCLVGGGFQAFKWINLGTKIYVRCTVEFCTNKQLYAHSVCFDSCANSIRDSNTSDAGETRRRKRAFGDGQETVQFEFEVTEEDENCVNPTMAKAVIGALVSLLALATLATVLLFCRLHKTKLH